MAIVDALHARNEPLLTTPLSVRSATKYTYRRRRRAGGSHAAAIGSNEMDEDGIYGGRIGRPTSGSTTPGNGAAAAAAAATAVVTKSLNLHQCRSYTSVLLILSFVQNLLQSKRTTTTREVYYHYVTHFRSQRECDAAILDCAALLQVPRVALGLAASPKGWFCGCVEIMRCHDDGGSVDGETTCSTNAAYASDGGTGAQSRVDGTALSSVQGLPITREWIDRSTTMQSTAEKSTSTSTGTSTSGTFHASQPFQISSRNAKCILVIEKEGVYTRLSEDRFYDRYPCILVTGKGYPDLATRALVYTLHTELGLPVYGLCDCNPYGIGVLQTYRRGSARMGLDGTERYGVPIQWVGLRPSQVHAMRSGSGSDLPSNVFQALTNLDRKKIARLGEEGCAFVSGDDVTAKSRMYRRQELALMDEMGIKVELESLHWMGMDYMCKWLEKIMLSHEKLQQKELQKEEDEEEGEEEEETASTIDTCSVKDASDDDASCSSASSSLNGKEEMIRSLSCVCIL